MMLVIQISRVLCALILSACLIACENNTGPPPTVEDWVTAGDLVVVQELVEANPALVGPERAGMPLLMLAVSGNHANSPAMARLLIDHGADVNEVYEEEGWVALELAMNNGNLECVQILLDHGTLLDRPMRDGMLPLDQAKYFLSTYTDPARELPGEVADAAAFRQAGIAQWEAVIEMLEAELAKRTGAAL